MGLFPRTQRVPVVIEIGERGVDIFVVDPLAFAFSDAGPDLD